MAQPHRVVPAVRSRSALRPPDWLRGVRILIVEDNLDHQLALRLMVESFGATVRGAIEGHEALVVATAWTPDLILCDLILPGMDGYTFMRRLQHAPGLRRNRVIAVSALSRVADVKRTRLAGFEAHLAKPIDYNVLADVLERAFWGRHP